ncbi:MAG: DUF2254 domain-containing protein [Theionarchaea archaeon]|nr:DUF2254 domain-containing protein [Theionarchaea archaeon]
MDTALYLLSALVQSEAAILAIVITLSLVAVQLTSSSYSPRVIDVFRHSLGLWLLTLEYIFTMLYTLFVLKMVKINSESNFEAHISMCYFSAVFCFTALIPYTLNMFDLLEPSIILEKLSENVTRNNILKAAVKNNHRKDPIQPIIDLLRGSLMKYDYETIGDVLGKIKDRIYHMLEEENLTEKEKVLISELVYNYFSKISRLIVSREEKDLALEIISNMKEIGTTAVERKLEIVVREIVSSLGEVGRKAVERGLEEVVREIVSSLG